MERSFDDINDANMDVSKLEQHKPLELDHHKSNESIVEDSIDTSNVDVSHKSEENHESTELVDSSENKSDQKIAEEEESELTNTETDLSPNLEHFKPDNNQKDVEEEESSPNCTDAESTVKPDSTPKISDDTTKIHVDKNGKEWIFFRSVSSDEEIEQIRKEQNAWLLSNTDPMVTFRCSNHAPKRGSCPHRMLLVEENGAHAVYERNVHNHVVVPSTTVTKVPVHIGSNSKTTTNEVSLANDNEANLTQTTSHVDKSTVPQDSERQLVARTIQRTETGGFRDPQGFLWILVKTLESEEEIHEVCRTYHVMPTKRTEKSISLRCATQPCPYRMIFFFKSKKIYSREVHNHSVGGKKDREDGKKSTESNAMNSKVTHAAPTMQTRKRAIRGSTSSVHGGGSYKKPKQDEMNESSELLYMSPNGDPYNFVCSASNENEVEHIRCQKQVYYATSREDSRWYRCSKHSAARGFCPYRLLVIRVSNNLFKVYERNRHNHTVVPIVPTSNKLQNLAAADFDTTFKSFVADNSSNNNSRDLTGQRNSGNKNSKTGKVGKNIQEVPEFVDADGNNWDYLCTVKGDSEMERLRRQQQMVCKGRKGENRYHRCQYQLEGYGNCSFRLVSIEGPKGIYKVFTENRHSHVVMPIDESLPSRHSTSKALISQQNASVEETPKNIGRQTNFANKAEPQKQTQSRFSAKDLDFQMSKVREPLDQLASELLLILQEDGPNSFIFMSREEELSSQVLVFTDEKDAISVSEYHDDECTKNDIWPKAGTVQFISAARGKCFEFFFETPLSVSRRTELLVTDGN